MHACKDINMYKIKSEVIFEKWRKEQPSFHKYFIKQWVNSSFNNWQLFHTPPGFSQSNSPIESYNKVGRTKGTTKVFLVRYSRYKKKG